MAPQPHWSGAELWQQPSRPPRDPVRNTWVIEFGMIACVLIFPMAAIFGPLRGVPLFWQMIDCSFGVVGFVPLWLARRDILALEKL